MTDGLHNRWWLDVVAHGHLPQDVLDTVENDWKVEINCRPGDEAILAQGKVDWLGLTIINQHVFKHQIVNLMKMVYHVFLNHIFGLKEK